LKSAYSQHPSVQKLLGQYEAWEDSFRREAETRLGGFKPIQQLLDTHLAEEFQQSLRKVKTQQSLFENAGMQRCASEGSLTNAASESGSARARGQRVHLRQDWDVLSSFHPEANVGRHSSYADSPNELQDADSGGMARFPRGAAAPALRDKGPVAATAAAAAAAAGFTMLGTVLDEDSDGVSSASSSSSWLAADEGSRQLEAVAARLLAQSRQAIQNAQQTLQETATNCQANLQSLGALLQQVSMQTASEYGMPRSGSTGSMQVVPWQRGSSGTGAPDSPTAASWDLVPRFFGEEIPHPTNGTNMGSSSSLAVFAREANGQEIVAADGAEADAQVRVLVAWSKRSKMPRPTRKKRAAGGVVYSIYHISGAVMQSAVSQQAVQELARGYAEVACV
jgi:hypothetical protein